MRGPDRAGLTANTTAGATGLGLIDKGGLGQSAVGLHAGQPVLVVVSIGHVDLGGEVPDVVIGT